MKLKRCLAISLFLLLIVSQISAQKNSDLMSFPFHLDLDKAIKNRFQEQFGENDWNQLIIEQFYPIGWSRTGKFAYLVEPADEACGCYMATFVIQDLKTDKILWKHRYEGPDGTEQTPETRQTFWRAKRALFARKLKEHGIQPSKQFPLLSFPIKYETDELIPRLGIIRDEKSDYPYPENVSQVIVKMNSKQKGEKVVHKESFDTKKMFSFVLDADLFGYFTSPFEPRVALIVVEVQRGWEGPPHVTVMRVIGASLVSGFKK